MTINRTVTVGALVGVAVLALSPIVKRWMHLDTLRDDDDLAGRAGLAENQGAGIHPTPERA